MVELTAIEICQQLWKITSIEEKALQVHSVFSTSFNIIGEELFFSVLSEKYCLHPMSLRIAGFTSFTDYGILPGMSISLSAAKLFFPQTAMSIRLETCKKRDLSIRSVEGLSIPKDMGNRIDLLKRLIREKGCENDLSTLITGEYRNPYAEAIMKSLPELNQAVRTGDRKAVTLAGKLAGGGIGLTPSSDDLLVGYLCVFLADAKARDHIHLEEAFMLSQAMGSQAAEHTNVISGAFLKQCGTGLFSEDMINLLKAFYSNSGTETVRLCAQRILKFGSTSGTDILTGMVLAMMNLYNECTVSR